MSDLSAIIKKVKRKSKVIEKYFGKYLRILLVVAIGVIILLSLIGNIGVKDVKGVKAFDAAEDSVSLSWHSVKGADGYHIFGKAGKKPYKKLADIEGAKKHTYKCENLRQATKYDFYVIAYRSARKGEKLSANHTDVSAFTKPSKQSILSITSPDDGSVLIIWSENKRSCGYEIEYSNDESFKSSKKTAVDDKGQVTCIFDSLTPKDTFYFKVRSAAENDGKTVFGEWSDVGSVKVSDKAAIAAGINKNQKMIALTFDDGPGYNEASDRILDVFEKYRARATFFMVGENAACHTKNVKRKVELGCEIGNHTYDHRHYGKNVTSSDIKRCSDTIFQICGQYPTAFRSTGGSTTDSIREECRKEGMPLYYWSLDTRDWSLKDADKVYDNVIKNVKDGDIILLHEIYTTTADAIERLVPALIKEGYQLVTATELVQAKTGKAPQPGQQYVNAERINNATY